jgi:hypothetical protein
MNTSNSTGQIDVTVKESSGGGSSTASASYGNTTLNGTTEIYLRETLVTLARSQYLRFPIKNVWHRCTLLSVGNGIVTFVVESTPQTITVAEGESKSVDVTGDGIADVIITVVKIYSSGATVKFTPVVQPAAAVTTTTIPAQATTTTIISSQAVTTTTAGKNESVVPKGTVPSIPRWAYFVSIGLLLVIAVLIYFMIEGRKLGK